MGGKGGHQAKSSFDFGMGADKDAGIDAHGLRFGQGRNGAVVETCTMAMLEIPH